MSKEPAREPTSGALPARVVCIGSSAGGLEALTAMMASLPTELPFAYLVAQHLSPTHSSALVSLLSSSTKLPVRLATHGTRLEPRVVLVAAPNVDLEIDQTSVQVLAPGPAAGPNPNIDLLMVSAATTWGERSAAVVLSGTGHDGSAGVRAIRAAGGLTIAQSPESAQFSEMPASAAGTDAVDLVLPPTEIGRALYRRGDDKASDPPGPPEPASSEPATSETSGSDPAGSDAGVGEVECGFGLAADTAPEAGAGPTTGSEHEVERIVTAVRAVTTIDFAGYKQATVRRQVARRMNLMGTRSLPAYSELIERDAQEARALASALLVSVTSFFRDPHVWQALKASLRPWLEAADVPLPVRVWVPGCATGEEVYSLGILIAELLGNPPDLSHRLKIFATDLSDDALDVARKGQYSAEATTSISPERQERWLRPWRGGWEIVPALRDCVVFARHNVAWDPPFPKMHLVSLRNTMIYFGAPLQERVLRLLHFSLVPGGLLLMGESERVVENHLLFETLDGKDRLYRRRATDSTAALPTPQLRPTPQEDPPVLAAAVGTRVERVRMQDEIVARFMPPGLVLDAQDDVIEVIGEVSAWCWVAAGQHSSHVVALLREELRLPVRTLLLSARHGDHDRAERLVPTSTGDVLVGVTRLGTSGRAVVTFTEPPALPSGAGVRHGATRPALDPSADPLEPAQELDAAQLARDLASTEAALGASIEQLSTSNEELQALNEELQASAEELQASSEEVQASNEELEATNEELTTLNVELQKRGDRLASANANLENIQASLTNGLVMVDEQLRVTRFTPLAVRVFALIETDIGRPLVAIPSTIDIPDLERHLRAATLNEHPALLELHGDRADVLLQIQPYRQADGTVRGAIVLVTEITELAEAHRRTQRSLRDLTAITGSLSEAVWRRDETGQILFVNERMESLFGLSRQRVRADPSLLLAVLHPEDRDRVAAVTAGPITQPYQVEYRIQDPDGQLRWVRESGASVPADHSGPAYMVVSALDVTRRHELTAQVQANLAMLEAVFNNAVFGVLIVDASNHLIRANDFFARISGYEPEDLIGMPVSLLVDPDSLTGPELPVDGTGPSTTLALGLAHRRLISRSGTPHVVTIETRPVDAVTGADRVVIVHDVTQLHAANAELASHAMYDQQTGLLVRTRFRALLAEELARVNGGSSGPAVLWIDLDGFKAINDRYGHQAGDVVLVEVARRLQRAGRRQDAVGRLGGDEFAMLVTDVDRVVNLEAVTDRILAELRDPIVLADAQVFVSGSMGIALAPGDGTDPDVLMHNADTAMYAAKQAGRDRRVYFGTEMNEIAQSRADMRYRLAEAVRERQFVMHYQPVIDTETGDVQFVEALLRWKRDGSVIAAADFIGLAVQTGQMRTIGRLALELVDADLRTLDQGLGHDQMTVAVNLAPAQLEDRDVLDWLLAWRPAGGFDRVVIEVTEADTLVKEGRAVEALSLLSRLGARISIDDFGTGYSNLALLDQLRPTLIKMDRSLLVRALDEKRGREVLRAAVQLAHALEATVVVEGVEDEPLWALTQEFGVELAQGYHLARPMPLDELIAWIRGTS